jgi:pimeloyl-ACP methyl ester carboxylesterase
MKWIRRVGLGLVCVVLLVALAGAAYEALGRRRAARDFPAPGKLVDIGGRRIQIDCRGSGAPTVVFEDGLDVGGSVSWSGVHDSVARFTRACAYSRAGIMWSDPKSGPQIGKSVAEDLQATLSKSGEKPPYVLVGHSLGGPYAMIYTKYFGPEVAGLVFVDASHPEQVKRVKAFTPQTLAASLTMFRVGAALARFGLVRKMSATDSAPPEPAQAVRATAAYTSTSLPSMLKEAEAFDQTLAEAGTFKQLGTRPVFVLTATAPKPKAELAMMKMTESQGEAYAAAWVQMQNEIASWSSRSQHELVPNASHYIQFDQPGIVTKAIRSVVDSVRVAH